MALKRERSPSPVEETTKKAKVASADEEVGQPEFPETQAEPQDPSTPVQVSTSNNTAQATTTAVAVQTPPSILRRPQVAAAATGASASPALGSSQSSPKSVRFDLNRNTVRGTFNCGKCRDDFAGSDISVLLCGHYSCVWCVVRLMSGPESALANIQCSRCRINCFFDDLIFGVDEDDVEVRGGSESEEEYSAA